MAKVDLTTPNKLHSDNLVQSPEWQNRRRGRPESLILPNTLLEEYRLKQGDFVREDEEDEEAQRAYARRITQERMAIARAAVDARRAARGEE